MRPLRRLMRRIAIRLLYGSGLLWLYAARRLAGRAFVLMYHRVLPPGSGSFSSDGIVVTPATFAAQMAFLRRHFHPLTPAQFHACLKEGRFPKGACLVTFDDGWADNAAHALPILQRYGVPAAVFVATGYVGTDQTFWQERLARRLFETSRSPDGASRLAAIGLADAAAAPEARARRLIRARIDRLKAEGPAAVRAVEDALRRPDERPEATAAETPDTFMSWGDVRQLHASGLVSIGSHAHSHTPLTRLGDRECVAEFERAAREIEANGLPRPVIAAYPNGDCNDTVVAAARSAGLELCFTTEAGPVSPGDDSWRVRRINVHESATASDADFLCRILGLA